MSLSESLAKYLISDQDIAAIVANRVHIDHVPQNYAGPYIWIGRSSASDAAEECLTLGGDIYKWREAFNIEVVSEDPTDSEAVAGYIKRAGSYAGPFGTGMAQAFMVQDHADDYLPRGLDMDEGRFVAALESEILGYSE